MIKMQCISGTSHHKLFRYSTVRLIVTRKHNTTNDAVKFCQFLHPQFALFTVYCLWKTIFASLSSEMHERRGSVNQFNIRQRFISQMNVR